MVNDYDLRKTFAKKNKKQYFNTQLLRNLLVLHVLHLLCVLLFFTRNDMGNNKKHENNSIRVNISIPKDTHSTHAKLAVKFDMSFSAYVRFCLRKHLETESKKLFPLK